MPRLRGVVTNLEISEVSSKETSEVSKTSEVFQIAIAIGIEIGIAIEIGVPAAPMRAGRPRSQGKTRRSALLRVPFGLAGKSGIP